LATVWLSLVLLPSAGTGQVVGAEAVGEVEVTASVAGTDLVSKPVPNWRFKVAPRENSSFRYLVETDAEGAGDLALKPGEYLLTSDAPLELEGKRYSWELPFRVESGSAVHLELTHENALVEGLEPRGARLEMEEDDVYKAARSSVFKVLSGSGQGSGFLIDSAGLVLTDRHLIADSDYLAIMVAEERKYSARVLGVDELSGVALLQINPLAVEELEPLVLAGGDTGAPSTAAGEWVLAVGSPLMTDTPPMSGLVIRVEDGSIYTDARIDPDRFGGPLLNRYGEVVGINTSRSGTVRLSRSLPLLESVTAARFTASFPPAYPLPAEAEQRIPTELLAQQAVRLDAASGDYHLEVGQFDVQLVTPVVVASLAAAATTADELKEYKPGRSFYRWQRYVGDTRAVVTVQAVPESSRDAGSRRASVGGAEPQGGGPGVEFERMELWRGGELVLPIHPRRFTSGGRRGSYYGSYEYPPEAFEPGAKVTLRLWKQGDLTPSVKVLPAHRQERVWAQFVPYFEALDQGRLASSSD
jgi:S1-C subfamily serine protease